MTTASAVKEVPVVPALPQPSFAGSFTPPGEVGPPKSFMAYGDTGTHKTSMIGELYKAGFFKKILFLDIDNGSEVLSNDPIVKKAIEDGHINLIRIDPFAMDSRMKIENIILEVAGLWREPSRGSIMPNPNIPDFGFDLFVIDTFNMAHEIALSDFQATTYNAAGTKLDGLAAYGRVAKWDEEMLRVIHNSSRFTGAFLMHPKTEESKTGAPSKVRPKLSGSFKDSIATIPSLVGYLNWEQNPENSEVVLTATVGESDLYDTKNRFDLPNKIYDFSFAGVYATIYNQQGLPQPTPVAPAKTAVATAA